MKKIINDPEHVVSEMLAGIEISDSSLKNTSLALR